MPFANISKVLLYNLLNSLSVGCFEQIKNCVDPSRRPSHCWLFGSALAIQQGVVWNTIPTTKTKRLIIIIKSYKYLPFDFLKCIMWYDGTPLYSHFMLCAL